MTLKIGGYNREVAYDKLGPTLLIAAALVMAIRTVKWTTSPSAMLHGQEWEAEIERSLSIVDRILSMAAKRWPQKFSMRDVAWHIPADDEEVPR